MPYRYLEEIATADAAFKAWGESPEAMFIAAADATMNVMVGDIDAISRHRTLPVRLDAEALDMLLFGLLQEIIFYKDADQLLLRVETVQIKREPGLFFLEAETYGERIDPEKHDLQVDVKAVTLHRFKVEQTARGWEALVILDV